MNDRSGTVEDLTFDSRDRVIRRNCTEDIGRIARYDRVRSQAQRSDRKCAGGILKELPLESVVFVSVAVTLKV